MSCWRLRSIDALSVMGRRGARSGHGRERELNRKRDRRGDSVISLTSRIETSVRSLPQRFRFFTVDSDSAPVFFRMSSSVRATMLFLHDQSRASPRCHDADGGVDEKGISIFCFQTMFQTEFLL